MLIYTQLGPAAEQEFAQTWGIGYALDNASEWQDVAKTAAQAALVLVILDLLRITKCVAARGSGPHWWLI